MKKFINGVHVDMTTDEQAKYDARQTDWDSKSAERKLEKIREMRNQKLQETDWYSNSDVTMPNNIKTWRQQLRNLPQDNTTESQYDTLLEVEGNFPNKTFKHSIWTKPS